MLDPQPTFKENARHYPEDYHAYQSYAPHGRKERFALYLYRLYFTQSFAQSMQRQERRGGLASGARTLFLRVALLPFKHLLRGTSIRKGARILDVGCGNGAFLYKMKQAGMETHGVELSHKGCRAARTLGLDVREGILEQQRYPPDHFDVITLNHVFEHVPDPKETLRELKRILKPGGVLIMAFPNASSLACRMFRTYWASLDMPRHLAIFSPKTIAILARAQGFSIERTRYLSFPFAFQGSFAYLLSPASRTMKTPPGPAPLDRTFIGKTRLFYWLFFPLVYLVDLLHIGDVIEVHLRKDETSAKARAPEKRRER